MSMLRPLFVVVTGCLLAACSSAVEVAAEDGDWLDEGISAEQLASPTSAHIMPVTTTRFLQDDAAPEAREAAHKLEWFGGPVISHTKVVTVHWGTGVRFADWLDSFYGDILKSAHVDWLHEYDTTNQTIGRGEFISRYVDTGAPAGSKITDEQIRAELQKLIAAGKVPANDPDMLYMFHFPPGITIQLDQYASCSYFCAYHNTIDLGGDQFIYYGVIPDMGGGCAFGCGFNTGQNNTTSVSSHELVEAITDPAVGAVLGDNAEYPLAWYDEQGGGGEIGDICNAQQANVGGYTIQKEWSNQANGCIAVKANEPPPSDFSLAVSPASQTVQAGGSTTFTVQTGIVSGTPGAIALSVGTLPAGVSGVFSPSSVNAGGSATLTLTTTADAAASTTSFRVTGSVGAAAHGADATLVVTRPSPSSELMVNGGFELGKRTGWVTDGRSVWATQRRAHEGAWSGKIGSALGNNGADNGLYQGVAVPASGTTSLSFWYYPICHGTIATDHQQAFITDASGKKLATLLDVCQIKKGWTHVTADLSRYAGQTVMVYFNDHDEGGKDTSTYFYLDEVSVVHQG